MVWDEILNRSDCMDTSVRPPPTPPTWDEHVQTAREMRAYIQQECDKTVCAVCSMYRRTVDVTAVDLSTIPNINLLDAALPSTPEHPRHGHTTFTYPDINTPDLSDRQYCLQPAACHIGGEEQQMQADVCTSCMNGLSNGRVPAESLVCIDPGMPPCCIGSIPIVAS
jgi:hypothetical protein